MPHYRAPVADVMFLLEHVFQVDRYRDLPGFEDASVETVAEVLGEAARLCEEVFQPLNRTGDQQGCRREADGTVRSPAGFPEAFASFARGGWIGLAADPTFGGQGLPYALSCVVNEFATSANMALSMYAGLTMGAIAALQRHGSEEQKRLYLPRMVAGEWSGTMNLTEPHCGTDLGLIRTMARPRPDGSFAVSGAKIFISAGEHDVAENIVHLVLARIEGAPEGTRGISLFLVPKRLVNADGSLGARNAVSCGALEHKMGIHGNATCVMNYDGATGWLVGEANRGLSAMFVMMNEARLAVGIQGLAMAEVAAQNAASYVRERRQGRALGGPRDPGEPADPLIVHPDVRRTLMGIRAFTEAGRALYLAAALQSDVAHRSADARARQAADDRLGLMTPVLKGVLTDLGFAATVDAQQMFGGHGYIAEWGMEQFVRDARIAMIYEGANGIQALDLVGRKLPRDGGRAVTAFFGESLGYLKERAGQEALAPLARPALAALDHLQKATLWFMQHAVERPDHAGAGATDYMHLFGLSAMATMWVRMAEAALRVKAEAGDDAALAARMDAKLATARFFMERILPGSATRLARVTAGADAVMALPDAMF
ncbi:MAG: acyl-CoA dehydrogenase C-terminal domain-containing protein [Alsobacter sp.]